MIVAPAPYVLFNPPVWRVSRGLPPGRPGVLAVLSQREETKMKKHVSRHLARTAAMTLCLIAAVPARADDEDRIQQKNRYLVTNLVSDIPGIAPNTDPVLQNAWGVAFSPGASPFWISDNATGCSTLYDGTGLPQPQPTPLQVKLPLPGGSIPSTACMHVNPPPASSPNPTPAAPTGM